MTDIIIIITLLFTILYLWTLNKKIVQLKNTKEDLTKLMKGFDDAIIRAEININEMKHLSSEVTKDIQNKIDKANFLANDLSFHTDRSSELLEKLNKMTLLLKRTKKNFLPNSKKLISETLNNIDEINKDTEVNKDNFIKSKTKIESLIEKISEIKQNDNYIKNDETSFKPLIERQDKFYKSLRKI